VRVLGVWAGVQSLQWYKSLAGVQHITAKLCQIKINEIKLGYMQGKIKRLSIFYNYYNSTRCKTTNDDDSDIFVLLGY